MSGYAGNIQIEDFELIRSQFEFGTEYLRDHNSLDLLTLQIYIEAMEIQLKYFRILTMLALKEDD